MSYHSSCAPYVLCQVLLTTEHTHDITCGVSIVASWHGKHAPHDDVISLACCVTSRVSQAVSCLAVSRPFDDWCRWPCKSLASSVHVCLSRLTSGLGQASVAAATAPRWSHRRNVVCLGCSCACHGCYGAPAPCLRSRRQRREHDPLRCLKGR